jgi:hypothetical protein
MGIFRFQLSYLYFYIWYPWSASQAVLFLFTLYIVFERVFGDLQPRGADTSSQPHIMDRPWPRIVYTKTDFSGQIEINEQAGSGGFELAMRHLCSPAHPALPFQQPSHIHIEIHDAVVRTMRTRLVSLGVVRFSFNMQETHGWHVSVRIVWHHRLVLGNFDIMRTVGLAIPRRTCYRRPTLEEFVVKQRYLHSPGRVRRLRHTCPASWRAYPHYCGPWFSNCSLMVRPEQTTTTWLPLLFRILATRPSDITSKYLSPPHTRANTARSSTQLPTRYTFRDSR